MLATNVAETSLTVPGIRYVVDPGTARISRYSARLKVQRLPIEPISQASADQRKGRCGRTSDGICIRLYAEEDFDERPRFTDPEILRTSLAAVILQMAALGLGDVEDFPFLDPPDRRQVRDGVTLLHELGRARRAQRRRSPPLGRRLAQLPVDPRLGRMVLEADRLGCADEVDRHRRRAVDPGPARAPGRAAGAGRPAARPLRRRALGLPRLPEPLALPARAAARAVGQPVPQARARPSSCTTCACASGRTSSASCAAAAKEVGVTLNRDAGRAARRSTSRCCPGLLSHVGAAATPARREYLGRARRALRDLPRARRWRARPPTWVMVAELVETSRLWGRDAGARSTRAGSSRSPSTSSSRTYAEPRWDRRRARRSWRPSA